MAALGLGAGCSGDSATGGEAANRFAAGSAWRLVERQVAVGQRPAGSPQLQRLAAELRPLLPGGRFEAIPGEPRLRNVVGTLPGARPGIVVGAHYDTLVVPRGFVGANNGAAGTAVVVEVARALRRLPAGPGAREVRFVLFDGEEPLAGLPEQSRNFYAEGLRGSRAYVAAHRAAPTRWCCSTTSATAACACRARRPPAKRSGAACWSPPRWSAWGSSPSGVIRYWT